MPVAIAFCVKDRVELSKRTLEPLLKAPVDVYLIDGSTTDEGKHFAMDFAATGKGKMFMDVRGGPDAAVAFALTKLLETDAEYIGLSENDVLLPSDWFNYTFALFDRGLADGLPVGAVSARAYADRILFQRDGYCVAHNLGWGMQIMTREAATLALHRFRTSYTTENRRTFAKLAATDIGAYWAFRKQDSWVCADWGNDKTLAAHGLASLALVPSPVQMIGQVPPLAQQGLTIAETAQEQFRNDKQFELYAANLRSIRDGSWSINDNRFGEFHDISNGSYIYFAHQIPSIGGKYEGDWVLRFQQGYGPFAWSAQSGTPSLTVPIIGTVDFLVAGGAKGGQVRATDLASGYECSPTLAREEMLPQVTSVVVPATVSYRQVKFEALAPGVTLFGIKTREPQPWSSSLPFTHATLPPVAS